LKRTGYSANIGNEKRELLWSFTTLHSISFTPCSISFNQPVKKYITPEFKMPGMRY
jgi:hypothetical protein